jgi:hypothetical protein
MKYPLSGKGDSGLADVHSRFPTGLQTLRRPPHMIETNKHGFFSRQAVGYRLFESD